MKIYTNGFYDQNGEFVDGGRAITQDDMDAIAQYMDDDIREELHLEMAPCSPEDFLAAYLDRDPNFEEEILEEIFQFER